MKLNPLPRGVTGFSTPDPETASNFDAKDFKAACHQVMRQVGGEVLGVDTNLIARNYFVANVDLGGRRISILCNVVFAFIAFVKEGEVGFTHLSFLEEEALAEAFRASPPFKPLGRDWLEERVSMDDLVLLTDHEIQQARYWIKTGFVRIGEVVFNCWD